LHAIPFAAALLAEQPGLRRYASGLTSQPADADDLVQETNCRALSRRTQFKGQRMAAWLHMIARRLYLDGKARRPTDQLKDRVHRAALDVESQALARHQLRLLPALDPALVLSVLGLSGREISLRLRIPGGTVYSRISRSRSAARAKLELGDRAGGDLASAESTGEPLVERATLGRNSGR